jgi:transcriptional regulator, LysR family
MAFDAVARHESLTRAAGALCLSLSAISKQLSSLESFLGQNCYKKRAQRRTDADRPRLLDENFTQPARY